MGSFIQNQILGMQWLNTLIGKMFSVFGLDVESRFGGSLHFFLYDVISHDVVVHIGGVAHGDFDFAVGIHDVHTTDGVKTVLINDF